MNTLAVILSIWATVAICAVLFIRGASPRLQRAVVLRDRQRQRHSANASIAE
ncbi:hypothetical protein [Trinickia acidisoli]|uniref:hypothetical protein n=1 Tax=Trinickia acidisoli TaxID=2767482 RepID=UPI001A8EE05F|nr:hypothetical protein [Trinickia acidisoli]